MNRKTEMNLKPILEKVSNTINRRYAITFLAVYTLIKESPNQWELVNNAFMLGYYQGAKAQKNKKAYVKQK